MQNLLNQLIHKWRYEDIQYQQGESIEKIHQMEEALGYFFPIEFVTYLSTVNGMQEGESDQDLFYFWPSQLIENEKREFKSAGPDSIFIGFADRIVIESVYMIEISKSRQITGRISVKKKYNNFIAPNFRSFLIGYLNGLDHQLPIWERPSDQESKQSPLSLFFQNLMPKPLSAVV